MASIGSLSRETTAAGSASSSDVVRHDDSRLSDSRTPTAHASTHGSGGSDPVTPSAIGLGNVDNTSDLNKPISTATQTALNARVTTGTGNLHAGITVGGATSVNTTSTTYVALGSNDVSVTCTYPPSGRCTIWIRSSISCSLTSLNQFGIMSFEIRTTNSSGTQQVAASDDYAIFALSKTSGEALCTSCAFATVSGLPTSGTMYVRAMYRSVASGNTATFAYRSLTVVPSP